MNSTFIKGQAIIHVKNISRYIKKWFISLVQEEHTKIEGYTNLI